VGLTAGLAAALAIGFATALARGLATVLTEGLATGFAAVLAAGLAAVLAAGLVATFVAEAGVLDGTDNTFFGDLTGLTGALPGAGDRPDAFTEMTTFFDFPSLAAGDARLTGLAGLAATLTLAFLTGLFAAGLAFGFADGLANGFADFLDF
jgi:hypothetical protein